MANDHISRHVIDSYIVELILSTMNLGKEKP